MGRIPPLFSTILLLAVTGGGLVRADGPDRSGARAGGEHPGALAQVDYSKEVRPLFLLHCSRCHGARKQEAGLRLDAGTLVRKGGDDGPVVVPGKPDQSKLLARVTAVDESRMPPEGERLAASEVSILRSWIRQGATPPADERIPPDPTRHWSFQRPKSPPVPELGSAVAANPIDAFIEAKLKTRGCQAVGSAPRHVLLRRVTLDLTGLPPTTEELQAFLSDRSPIAFARVVDRLLASPEYAERWGRHWMDVWRYSDWYGFGNELRNSARFIWRWRDWIVESLAADKPYDEMIAEMLAADELDPTNSDRLRATGFLARNYYLFNRNVWLDATIEHTGKAFLGVTLNCARCHDHMYDPIEQADYYRFRAIFEPYQVRLDRVPGQINAAADGMPRVFDADLAARTYLFARGNEQQPDREHPLSPGVPAALHGPKWEARPIALPPTAFHPGLLSFVQSDDLAAAESTCKAAAKSLAQAKKRAAAIARPNPHSAAENPTSKSADAQQEMEDAQRQCEVEQLKFAAAQSALDSLKARIAAEQARFGRAPGTNAHELALRAAKAERVAALCAAQAAVAEAKYPPALDRSSGRTGGRRRGRSRATPEQRLLAAERQLAQARKNAEQTSDQFTPLSPTYPATSSGRRSALARWIASQENPLTARVAVNHIWMRHFGQPLVPTVFDFGLNGKPPTHPELLDWLAVEFMRSGWSMKRLHRRIVLSNAYQRDSEFDPARVGSASIDPDNHLLWRMNARRLESEAVRDSVLAVSERLDRRRGGTEFDAALGETTFRRSIYYRHAPEKFMTFLQVFDAPSTNECYRRIETIVPQQALALANSTLAIDLSRRLAGELSKEVGKDARTDKAFVEALFERVLSRAPSDAEWSTCREFLSRQSTLLASPKTLTRFEVGKASTVKGSRDPRQRAREGLAHVLLNHNEFVTIR